MMPTPSSPISVMRHPSICSFPTPITKALHHHDEASTLASCMSRSSRRPQGDNPKSVSFLEKVTTERILSRACYSTGEKRACWYSTKELQKIKRQVRNDVHFFQWQQAVEGELKPTAILATGVEYCLRGLEVHLRTPNQIRKEVRRAAARVVFQEQTLQKREGIVDPQLIADAYQGYTIGAARRAHRTGLCDKIASFREISLPSDRPRSFMAQSA